MIDDDKPQPAPPPAIVRDVLDWKARKETPAWAFAGAVRLEKWSVGEWVDHTRCTEDEYDNAIRRAMFGR